MCEEKSGHMCEREKERAHGGSMWMTHERAENMCEKDSKSKRGKGRERERERGGGDMGK
jgi:hypothetical protein